MFGKRSSKSEQLRGLINAGHQRGRPILRAFKYYPTFAMVALAGIGTMPDTVTDRAVNITMRRRKPDELVSPFRSARDQPVLDGIRDRLAAWTAEVIDELSAASPDLPVEDRAADTWEPLIAIADAAGGHWPQSAREACTTLVHRADQNHDTASVGIRLLTNIKTVFDELGEPFMSSADLVDFLRALDDAPWTRIDLTANKLANYLHPYGVKPGHNTEKTARGYRLEQFADAFERYTT